jgi:hypothetical protein
MGKEKAFQTMSSMTSAQLISVATAKGLTLNPPCIPPYTVSTKKTYQVIRQSLFMTLISLLHHD